MANEKRCGCACSTKPKETSTEKKDKVKNVHVVTVLVQRKIVKTTHRQKRVSTWKKGGVKI